jgi:hypothetical protein
MVLYDLNSERSIFGIYRKGMLQIKQAVQASPCFMGFRRAGEKIRDNVRSLINGLLREDRLKSDGQMIRRKS